MQGVTSLAFRPCLATLVFCSALALAGCAARLAASGGQRPSGGITESEVTFSSDGYLLHGTWSEVAGARVAAVLLHGSGLTDRDETFPADSSFDGHEVKLFRQIAAALNQAGVSTLRYDKRGVREMTAKPPSDAAWKRASYEQLVRDAAAAVQWIRARGQVDYVFLVGHSEGTLIALRLSAEHAGDRFFGPLVLLGTVGQGVKEALRYQLVEGAIADATKQLDANHDGAVELKELPPQAAQQLPLEQLDADHNGRLSPDEIEALLQLQFDDLVRTVAQVPGDQLLLNKPAIWFKQHFAAESGVALAARVRRPVLILHGGKDPNVPFEAHAKPLYAALHQHGAAVTLKAYPLYGHGLAPFKQGTATFGPIQPDVLRDLTAWVRQQLGQAGTTSVP